MTTRNEITIELGAAQMVWQSLLEPKALRPTVIHKVTVAPSWEDMRRLAKFIFLRIFAGSSDDIIGDDNLSDYCSDNVHYNKKLFQNLLRFVLMSVSRKVVFDWSRRINMNLKYSMLHGELNKEQQEKLSSITYEEIFKNLDNSPNCIPTTNVVKEYLDSNFTDEIINCALVNIDYERIANVGGKQAEYWIYESLLGFYFSKATFDLIRQLHNLKGNRINHSPTIIADYSLKDGCIYKMFKMFEISSKLQQPIIKHHSKSASSGSTSSLRKNQVKDALIDEIKAYGFYVEANITTEQVIKLSLNQVVETDETKCGVEKSTLPVCSLIYQLDDMYEAICVNMWNWAELIKEEGYSLVSNCNWNTKQLDRYTKFKDQLKVLINDMLMDSQRKIVDLDEKIHFLGENLDCKQGATITHRNVMEIGMLPYLKEIATALASSLKSTSMFVNYKVSSMVITGELLHSWLTRFNTVYGEYMWTQLQAELSIQFHVRQIRAKLIFAKKKYHL
ncbi:hypothetical protein MAM1_0269c08995 [Mucor ambiguus]|uniref:Uncharacterized protein n=1 Tax=Mucor ambiguus TaxID=91626 RepID=A0A0C9MFG8_9FUNG|nr:hypothetical protein MAM1_0269c08995 [Mucor ambiguus]